MTERFSIKREVETEAGREHTFWIVVDRESGYNKTFRDVVAAAAHVTQLSTTQEERA